MRTHAERWQSLGDFVVVQASNSVLALNIKGLNTSTNIVVLLDNTTVRVVGINLSLKVC